MGEEQSNPGTDLYKYLKARGLEKEIEDYKKLQSHQEQELTEANLENVLIRIAGFLKKWSVN